MSRWFIWIHNNKCSAQLKVRNIKEICTYLQDTSSHNDIKRRTVPDSSVPISLHQGLRIEEDSMNADVMKKMSRKRPKFVMHPSRKTGLSE